jgi:hypothetical protein
MNFVKLLIIFCLNLNFVQAVHAKTVEQKDLHFKIQIESLLKGEIHFSLYLLPVRELIEKFPEALDLDSLSALLNNEAKILVTKSVFIVNKPVGFFDHEHMSDEKYMSHIMGDQKANKIGKQSFKITVPGDAGHTYKVRTYFDSDDITTLPNSRIIQAVSAAKKLDVISQGASSTIFKEYSDFSKYSIAGTSVHSFIPLKEEKTLVISYKMLAVKKYYALEKLLKSNFLIEAQAIKSLMDSYEKK